MNDYNKKLQKLQEEAARFGYKFEDGQFVKDTDGFMPVMEVFFQWHTTYEDEGIYFIYKHTFEIEEKDFEKMIEFIETHDLKEYNLEENEDCDFSETFDEIVLKYLNTDHKCFALEDGLDGTMRLVNNHSSLRYCLGDDDEDHYGDIEFQPQDSQSMFPYGYISFYQIKNSDFQKAEDINMRIEKFMRYN